ncbi:MAG: SMI1/KNR4 family protein [Chitinophagaceae bacterium]|nr:SMI1/KNR4 family protein [Chitinophagaceae bacterium]
MKQYFEDFDFTDFWDDDEYALENYVEDHPSGELIASVEQELGCKLPASYIALMKLHNGGMPVNNCFPMEDSYIQICGIYGIGRTKIYSLCGELGSTFFTGEGMYPDIGCCICDTPSAGHDMIMLDYTKCGRQGEPEVVHVDDSDRITFLAKDFETFIRGLVNESNYDTSADEKIIALHTVEHGRFSTVLAKLCDNFTHIPEIGTVIRKIAKEVVMQKGHFSLHADDLSHLMYDIQFWLYADYKTVRNKKHYLEIYPEIMTLTHDGEFTMNGYAPGFVADWMEERLKSGAIKPGLFKLKMAEAFKQSIRDKLKECL